MERRYVGSHRSPTIPARCLAARSSPRFTSRFTNWRLLCPARKSNRPVNQNVCQRSLNVSQIPEIGRRNSATAANLLSCPLCASASPPSSLLPLCRPVSRHSPRARPPPKVVNHFLPRDFGPVSFFRKRAMENNRLICAAESPV